MFKNRATTMTRVMTLHTKTLTSLFSMLLIALILSSCAPSQERLSVEKPLPISDPMEEQNRRVFALNQNIDKAVINPVVKGYQAILPDPARTGIDNVLRNLRSPTTLANQLLQGDLKGAGDVILRTIINTFVGFGGLFDVAEYEGIKYEQEDFGQTLAKWGVGHGPYLVVPLIGPSSARDYAGFFIDSYADPLRWYLFNIDQKSIYYGKVGVEYLSLRSSLVDILEDLENSSIDYYAATRSAYYQRREALVNDENPDIVNQTADIPDYDNF